MTHKDSEAAFHRVERDELNQTRGPFVSVQADLTAAKDVDISEWHSSRVWMTGLVLMFHRRSVPLPHPGGAAWVVDDITDGPMEAPLQTV